MVEKRHGSRACGDDFFGAFGENPLAAGEARALLAFEGDRADQRAVVQAGAFGCEAGAIYLIYKGFFAR